MTYEVGCVIVHTWYNGREAFINISMEPAAYSQQKT